MGERHCCRAASLPSGIAAEAGARHHCRGRGTASLPGRGQHRCRGGGRHHCRGCGGTASLPGRGETASLPGAEGTASLPGAGGHGIAAGGGGGTASLPGDEDHPSPRGRRTRTTLARPAWTRRVGTAQSLRLRLARPPVTLSLALGTKRSPVRRRLTRSAPHSERIRGARRLQVDLARARVEVVTLTLIHPRRSRAPLPPHCWPPALPELACGPLHLQLSARGAAPIRRRPRRTPDRAVVTEQPHPPSSLGARQIWAILDGGPGNLGSRSARAVIRSIKGVIRSIKGVWRRRRGRRRGRRGRRGESGVAGGDGCARAVDVTT